MAGKAGKRTGSAISRGRRGMFGLALAFLIGGAAGVESPVEIAGEAELFAPGIASTHHSEIRLTISPDGKTALWFSRDRPSGGGGYDIWTARRAETGWGAATPVSFNTPGRDFDPAFSAEEIGRAHV